VQKVIRDVKVNPGGTILNRTKQCLLHADNVVVGCAVKHTAETTADLTTVASQTGLTINVSKTKYD
jgi:hypothetical protein